ncbi:monofunctional biosynthetic peptidoglycan transglycosylase [Methylobacillus flagellatus]|uniref:Biosynthetic peptidoglycan transglycosylase n=1 Tax=Methylobacillus flagellatus (strain ATCC 51484 / DSM 6875 / VKM B-1610 / KT) TaxID=265072 RepID=MTGA_METFK|nr:monofunctional biosynthetic peptidoglycan transglycosylase [Methylobacillus flagellatus]Q1GYH8.1 RecName: Full=Biosynthetic peptidoglycan transglycosylase; AltName: Full=Glycan polymerase; AltName: Full=Peptidoglycan glycosyltransferase MtgA; Short=PGT [Methylobacillus flagellatus KT]ABE50709.1 Monofunctional biosynthetic peptidoglycan transglycosylase [Methylobacillus flagellatus KT]
MIKQLFWRGLLLALVLVVLYQFWIFMHILWWVEHNPSSSAFMRASLSALQQDNPDAALKHQWVEYQRISIHLKRAVIAAEDAKFVGHEGFDWDGIQKAYEKNWKQGKIVAGGSTISQQLAKNLFLSTKRTPWRKLEEAVITWMLERMMSKRRIFEIYLNVIEWGNGVFGAEAAARHYYRTSASSLNVAQAARLAAMIPNPRYYDKHREARGLIRKARIIEARMRYAEVP